MRQYGGFKFAPPRGFSDWTKYAGFDRTTGMVPGGVAPSFGMLPVAPSDSRTLQQQLSDAGTAVQQLSQGNVSQAYNTMVGQAPAVPQTAQPQTQQQTQPEAPDVFDYLSGLGR